MRIYEYTKSSFFSLVALSTKTPSYSGTIYYTVCISSSKQTPLNSRSVFKYQTINYLIHVRTVAFVEFIVIKTRGTLN